MSINLLTVTLQYAHIEKKTFFSDLKSLIELNLGGTRFLSPVAKGNDPEWDHVFSLQQRSESLILVSLYEKGIFSDSLLGEGAFFIQSLNQFQGNLLNVPLYKYNLKIADIFFKVSITNPTLRPQTKAYKKIPEENGILRAKTQKISENQSINFIPEPVIQKKQEINLMIYGVQLSDIIYDKMIYSSQSGKQEIYLGRIITTNTPIAIKVSYCDNNEEFNRVQREALALGQLSHPNICKVYGTLLDMSAGKIKNIIVLEHCEGISLRHEIEARSKNGQRYFTEEEI